eukprot:6275062-Amphidinium_carterae.1
MLELYLLGPGMESQSGSQKVPTSRSLTAHCAAQRITSFPNSSQAPRLGSQLVERSRARALSITDREEWKREWDNSYAGSYSYCVGLFMLVETPPKLTAIKTKTITAMGLEVDSTKHERQHSLH